MEAQSDSLPRCVSRLFDTPPLRPLPAPQKEEQADRLPALELSLISATRLTLSFFPTMAGGRRPAARAREELRPLLQELARRHGSRGALSGSLTAVQSELTDKYIPQIVLRKKYACIEVSRGMAERTENDIFELAALYNSVFLPLTDRG